MKVVIWSDSVINYGKDTDLTCTKCLLKKTCHRRIELGKIMHNIIIEFECPDLIPKEIKNGKTSKT